MISRERCFTIPIGSFHRDHSDFPTGESCHRASFAWWPTVRLCLESISRRVRHLRRVDAYNVTVIADDWRTTLTDTVHYRIIVDSIEQGFSFRTPFRTPEFLPARETCFLLVLNVDEKGGRIYKPLQRPTRRNRTVLPSFSPDLDRFNNKSRSR